MKAGILICKDCGDACMRTGTRQEYCPTCREKREKARKKQKDKARAEDYRSEGWHGTEKYKRPVGKPKGYVAGAGCNRWKRCYYGSGNEIGGTCNYNYITGQCKVIEVNGKKMVAPTKDCPFFKPRGQKKEKLQKPVTIKGRNGRPVKAVLQLDLEGNILKEFESLVAAAKAVGMCNTGGISAACAGKQRTAGGYRWRFKEGC